MAEGRRKKRAGDELLDQGSPDNPLAFGDYEIVGKIGRGGMANVYHGRPAGGEGRRLAIKCMRPKLASEERFVEMFSREAKLALLLDHPGIVRTLDCGEAVGRFFIAMEYIPGHDLAAVLKRCQETSRRLPVPHGLYVIAAVARALSYAHRLVGPNGRPLNIVNRDVSPANIRIAYDGGVKLLDFGIAQAAVQISSEIGVLKGKFAYMSPEQIRGLPVDAKSDLFSLGVVAHEVLTGERLFREESEFALMEKVRSAPIRPPSAYDKRVPPEADAVVMGMLERDTALRAANGDAVAAALEPLLANYQFEPSELGRFLRQLYPGDYREELDLQRALAASQAPAASLEHELDSPSQVAPEARARRRKRRPSQQLEPTSGGNTKLILLIAGLLAVASLIMLVVALI